MNSKKIVVSTLALAMGAALVGSISGSVAWYQYSTRVTTAISGTSTGSSRNLQIASSELADLDDPTANGWGYHFAPAANENMNPSTPVFDSNNKITGFKSQPVYQYFTNGWKDAGAADTFQYSLYLQAINENNVREALDVYLTGYQLTAKKNNVDVDIIKDALRVQITPATWDATANEGNGAFADGTPILLSNKGGATTIAEKLDLNNNGKLDTDGFYADDSTGTEQVYKVNASKTSYDTVTFDSIKAGDDNPYSFTNKTAGEEPNAADHKLVTTDANHAVKLTIKIWLEGWQWEAESKHIAKGGSLTGYYKTATCTEVYGENETAEADEGADVYVKDYIWSKDTIGTSFNLDLRFGVEAKQ